MSIGVTVEMTVQDLAKTIRRLNRKDKEELLLLLSEEGKEIANRVKEIRQKKVASLTRTEIMKDLL